jgi:hypothetical protein
VAICTAPPATTPSVPAQRGERAEADRAAPARPGACEAARGADERARCADPQRRHHRDRDQQDPAQPLAAGPVAQHEQHAEARRREDDRLPGEQGVVEGGGHGEDGEQGHARRGRGARQHGRAVHRDQHRPERDGDQEEDLGRRGHRRDAGGDLRARPRGQRGEAGERRGPRQGRVREAGGEQHEQPEALAHDDGQRAEAVQRQPERHDHGRGERRVAEPRPALDDRAEGRAREQRGDARSGRRSPRYGLHSASHTRSGVLPATATATVQPALRSALAAVAALPGRPSAGSHVAVSSSTA